MSRSWLHSHPLTARAHIRKMSAFFRSISHFHCPRIYLNIRTLKILTMRFDFICIAASHNRHILNAHMCVLFIVVIIIITIKYRVLGNWWKSKIATKWKKNEKWKLMENQMACDFWIFWLYQIQFFENFHCKFPFWLLFQNHRIEQ